MSSDTLLSIANLLLPEVLVKYFDMTKHEIKGEEIHFYFTELNEVPEEYKGFKLYSKGFFPEATVQDFPIRGKNVYLHTSSIILTVEIQMPLRNFLMLRLKLLERNLEV